MSDQSPVIADLHCHIFPAAEARAAGTSIPIEPVGGGYSFGSGAQAMELDAGLLDLTMQVEDMQRQGVGLRALAIPPFTLRYDLPAAEGVRWARAINEGIAKAVAAYPDRFVGFATIPLQDVDAALAELTHATEQLGLLGVEIATHIADVELDAPHLNPFWERAEAQRLPILVHPHDPAGGNRMSDYYLRNLVGNPVETALAGARLIFGGVLERYPNLRVILSHGGGALPQLIGRLRHGYAARPEAQLRVRDPVASLRRLYYDTIVFNPEPLRNLVATVGASQVVLGTDYPFDMGEPDPVNVLRQAGLAEETVATILDNGRRLLTEAGSTRAG